MLRVGLFLILLASVVSAQESEVVQPSDLTVVNSSWRPYRKNITLEPGNTTAEDYSAMRARVKEEVRADESRNLPGGRVTPRPRTAPVKAVPKTSEDGYLYTVRLKNSGVKTIKAVEWMYLFDEPKSHQELGRHQFHTRQRIRPGEVKKLVEFEHSPPSKVISAAGLERGEAGAFDQRIILTRVEYADGSEWRQP